MKAVQIHKQDIEQRFLNLFAPNTNGYGKTKVGNKSGTGKLEADSWWVPEPPTVENVEEHLYGTTSLGFAMLREDKCRFGVIDIDTYPLDIQALRDKVAEHRLPLCVCLSKSGGAHLYLFFKEDVLAAPVRKLLAKWAALLGYPSVEVFPKQDSVAPDKAGSWINLPYFEGLASPIGKRYGFKHYGQEPKLPLVEDWLAYAQGRAVTLKEAEAAGSTEFDDGPPCLQAIHAARLGLDSGRNNALFSMGVYATQKYSDGWETKLDQYNSNFTAPLPSRQVASIANSLEGNDYFYRCNEVPCSNHCDKQACLQQRFGVGNHEELSEHAVILPGNQTSIIDASTVIFTRFANERRLYLRGRHVAQLVNDNIALVKDQEFRSIIEEQGPTYQMVRVRGGNIKPQRRAVSADVAKGILACEKHQLLPEIKLVVDVPLLTDQGLLEPGYNDCGVYVRGNLAVPTIAYDAAVANLLELLGDFNFLTPSDLSRGFASFITPSLRMGGLLGARVPVDIAEADQSQAGKTIRQAMVRAVFGANVPLIAQRKGGVGSVDESIGGQFISGHPFLVLDNWRGRMDSQYLEMAVTSPGGKVTVRVPNMGEVEVDISRVCVQASSNGMEMTRDLANRSCISRIRKQCPGYQFKHPNILDHVRAQQGVYLASVYAVVQHWLDAGKPVAPAQHDFSAWAGAMSWIVSAAGLTDLLDGHEAVKERTTRPILNWWRGVAQRMVAGRKYLISELYQDIAIPHDVAFPNRQEPEDEAVAARRLGVLSRGAFVKDILQVDQYAVYREKVEYRRDDGRGNRSGWKYQLIDSGENPGF